MSVGAPVPKHQGYVFLASAKCFLFKGRLNYQLEVHVLNHQTQPPKPLFSTINTLLEHKIPYDVYGILNADGKDDEVTARAPQV